MKVLMDHCVPRPFAALIVGHEVRTARQCGFEQMRNGELLAAASVMFDVVLTVDKNLKYQRNTSELPLPVVVLDSADSTIDALAVLAPDLLKLLGQPLARRVHVVSARPD